MPHENHPAIVRRLKRADGHLQTIIEMIENDRPCLQIAQQLQAVESAKKALIHDHISNCLERPLRQMMPRRGVHLRVSATARPPAFSMADGSRIRLSPLEYVVHNDGAPGLSRREHSSSTSKRACNLTVMSGRISVDSFCAQSLIAPNDLARLNPEM